MDELIRAKRPTKIPVVFTRDEAKAVINHLDGTFQLMTQLLYGSGLRLMECVRLRVKDIEFNYKQIYVRDGKGAKDRITVLPEFLVTPLTLHLQNIYSLHETYLKKGCGSVYLPLHWQTNIRMRRLSGLGNMYFLHRLFLLILALE